MSRESSVSIRYYDSAEDEYPADQFPDEIPEIEFDDDTDENPLLDSLEKELNKYSSGNSSFSGVEVKSGPKRDYWAELKQLEREMAKKNKNVAEDVVKIQQAQQVAMKASIAVKSKSTYDMVDGVEHLEVLLRKEKKPKQRSKLETRQEKNFDAMLDRFDEAADAKKLKQEAIEARGLPIPVVSLSREDPKKNTISSGLGVPGALTGPKAMADGNQPSKLNSLAVAAAIGASGASIPAAPIEPKELVNGKTSSLPESQDASGNVRTKLFCHHETCKRASKKHFKGRSALIDHLAKKHAEIFTPAALEKIISGNKPSISESQVVSCVSRQNIRCPYPSCHRHSETPFNKTGELNKHLCEKHTKEVNCPNPSCKRHFGKPFTNGRDLNMHLLDLHLGDLYCPYAGCKHSTRKPFKTLTNLNSHVRQNHARVDNAQGAENEIEKDQQVSVLAVEEPLYPRGSMTDPGPAPNAATPVNGHMPAAWDKSSITIKGEDPSESHKDSKKRKRAISNAESVPTQQILEVLDRSAEPLKKKSKKNKKEEKQNPLSSGYGPLSYRDVQNFVKEQYGKTISKKRQKKLEQKSEATSRSTQEAMVIEDSEVETIRPKKSSKYKHQTQDLRDISFQPTKDIILFSSSDIDMPPPPKKAKKSKEIYQHQQQADQTELSTQSTQDSALRLHEVPEYISKAEALRRTIIKYRGPPTSTEVVNAAAQRSRTPIPAAVPGSSGNVGSQGTDNLNNVENSHKAPEKSFISLANSSPAPLTPPHQRARSASATNSKGTKGKEKSNIEVEGTARDLIQAVDSMKKVFSAGRVQALFSPSAFFPSPAEGTPTRVSGSVVNEKTTNKSKKRKADDITQNWLVPNDWEQIKGKVRARITTGGENDDAEVVENVAFSASYISKENSIRVSHTAFSTHHLQSGEKIVLGGSPEEGGKFKLRICTVAEGRVRVSLGGNDKSSDEAIFFEIGKGGMFRVRIGEKCEVCAVGGDEVRVQNSSSTVAMVFIVGIE